jgi:hypothetical protein
MTVKSLFLANGGAIVAILAQKDETRFQNGLMWFAFGLSFAIITAACFHSSQDHFAQDGYNEKNKCGHGWKMAAIIAWLCSLSLFIFGVLRACGLVIEIPFVFTLSGNPIFY